MAKFLIASLVDPATHPGGAGTYTRGLVSTLRNKKNGHMVHLVAPLHPPPGPWYRSRQVISLARSYFSKLPAKALFARKYEFKMRIRQAARSQHFDAALINGTDMLWAIDELPPEMPKVLINHNLEHQVLTQQLANYRFISHILRREITKQIRYEIEGFHLARGAIFISATDMAWACTQVPGLRALHVPPLFTKAPVPRKRQPHGHLHLGFLADFAWWPNRQSWMWLIDEILPKVRRPVVVHVFGRQSEEMPAGNQVVAHGLVPELGEVWDKVDIMICPIRAGAGVNIKVAESLYNRMPVLATTLAVRGLECSPGLGLAIIDSAEEWGAFLNSPQADLLATQLPSEELSQQFSADRHIGKLDNFLTEVALGKLVT